MKQIGWQKYEDVLEQQLQSPLLQTFYNSFNSFDEEEFSDEELQAMQEMDQPQQIIPVDNKLMESVTLTSNFDCWMGHTNFNITNEIKEELNKVDGVEVLKIVSRYRFFVGVGKMFDFSGVRNNIESALSVKNGDKKVE